eukprot:Em0002g1459a
MLEPPVECSTPCQDGFAGHVDQSILLSLCAWPRVSNFSGTPDAVTIYDQSDESDIYQSSNSAEILPLSAMLDNTMQGAAVTSSDTLSASSSPVYGDAGAGAGECSGALIMCNITATSIYAPVDHNTYRNMFVTKSVLSPHLSDNEVSSEGTMSIPPPSDRDDIAPTDLEEWCGFCLVGDNVDKTIGPRDMRLNNQSKSLHFFHVYAVKDRVDVPLGVLLKNENKLDDMVEIMDELHKYTPSKTTVQVFDDGNGDVERMEIHHLSPIVLGGDQLTTARAIGSQCMKKNSHETTRRLVGFIPGTEDWHTKVCFMKASDDGSCLVHAILLNT